MMRTVLWRLAYLTVMNTFALIRLLLASARDKDVEILALRHQVAVLERQLGGKKVRFTLPDRALLAALLHHLRPDVGVQVHLQGRVRIEMQSRLCWMVAPRC
jgi:putative transposase